MGLTLALLVVCCPWLVAGEELTITRQFGGGFQCDFCHLMETYIHGWTAHIVLSKPVDSLDVYKAQLVKEVKPGQEYLIRNEAYNGNFEAGEKMCIKFTAHTDAQDLPKVYFYIEGIEHPVDSHGHTHPIPATTFDPSLHNVHALWVLRNIPNNEQDPLGPFHTQAAGHFDEGSLSIAEDPAAGASGKVLRVFYEKGHYVSIHSHRGAQFYGRPVRAATSLTLSFDIYFSPGFDFVKGGKLPGLFGGATNCSGGRHSDLCFSTRFMWRTNGDGEIYTYMPKEQDSSLCSQSDNHCNFDYGNSIGRGSWRFKTGKWQNVAQRVTLNTPGKHNGKVKVWYEGQVVLEVNNLNLRNTGDIQIEGLFFSTFFGGSDPSWAPSADCYTYYKNFVISADDSPAVIG